MKKYSKEFKDSIVQLIINENQKVLDVSQDLDINSKTLYHWVRTYKEKHNLSIKNNNSKINKESELDELKQLRRENKLLKQERDILKKATAYFAKETL